MSERRPPHVVVLGGGSAGWITACLLHRAWHERGGRVTVVESPDIGIVGVGEGSTPQLKAMFDHLGIAEAEWMAACDATFKLGIRFTGWSERPGFQTYFHPFPGPVDLHTEPAFARNCALARRGFAISALPDDYFLAARLAMEGKGPRASDTFPFAPSYGYHFDAYRLGAFLRDWGVRRGVDHLSRTVDDVEMAADGSVAALLCEDGIRIDGDIFVDCSGFRAMIAQGALGARYISFSDNLFNDRAVVMQTMANRDCHPQTDSVAMRAGWRWRIPLTTRAGNGYVYSSRHISDEDAEAELRSAIDAGADVDARIVRMKVGRLEESWQQNCLATGLAQGFIEPLEATALHIVIATALDFARSYEEGGFGPRNRDAFNARTAMRYDGIRDYIVAHYRMNQRSDTAYWRENAANAALSDNLKTMMTAWFTHRDIASVNRETYAEPPYPAMSWLALFAGYGTFPPREKAQGLPPPGSAADPQAITDMLTACTRNFAPATR
ncbi:tryptophan halogenase family protein [Aurantiacibacter spongiae]|uniref:Tryptophan 7-halogenase n=1 Tax=Aurantiacibacter spongiae TaxID=2488860 RepID=A0A3N5DMY2_9SPHN|nr:tryptophan halogenase family protein [Aurantiacibacter spongiae]RPF72265.1 tryptophan 7-halogenase [Aurantiacibacter spongiae]